MRWRTRGAWLWPTFVVVTVAEAGVGHELPPAGDSQTLLAAAIGGCFLNLLAVLFLSRPLGALLRRRRPDIPGVVARNYAGTAAVLAVFAVVLVAGLAHRSSVNAEQRAQADAIARAQAWIGDRAPAEFRTNLSWISTFAIQPRSIYRECVISRDRLRTYCVIVRLAMPFPGGVTFAGYEPNSVLSTGVG
jgi:hypothetical protein